MISGRKRGRPNGHAEQARRVPTEAPALSPSDILPSLVVVAEQPVIESIFFCPAWPGCQAEFADEESRKQHVKRHAHARNR